MTEAAGSLQKADREGSAVVARAAVKVMWNERRGRPCSGRTRPAALARCLFVMFVHIIIIKLELNCIIRFD